MLLATAQCNITATKCGTILLKWLSLKPQGNVPVITVNDTPMLNNKKYLGIVFDNKLQWTSHINKINLVKACLTTYI